MRDSTIEENEVRYSMFGVPTIISFLPSASSQSISENGLEFSSELHPEAQAPLPQHSACKNTNKQRIHSQRFAFTSPWRKSKLLVSFRKPKPKRRALTRVAEPSQAPPFSGDDDSNDRRSWLKSSILASVRKPKPKPKRRAAMKGVAKPSRSPPSSSDDDSKELKKPFKPGRNLLRAVSCRTSKTFQSVETHLSQSSTMMLDKYAFMSYRFPVTADTEKLFLRKQSEYGGIVIETTSGEMIGSIDNTLAKSHGIRRVMDVSGRTCAIIHQRKHMESNCGRAYINYSVYGDKPSTFGQEPVNNAKAKYKVLNGCYLWAEIKNTGSLSGKFVMNRYSSETSSCSADWLCAKRFGSLFSKGKLKGFTITDTKEKECAKMVSLENKDLGIMIARNRDMCAMLAFCAVVDEMVANLLI